MAQLDPRPTLNEDALDEWSKDFVNNPLHKELS
jgi:hypothetical protein